MIFSLNNVNAFEISNSILFLHNSFNANSLRESFTDKFDISIKNEIKIEYNKSNIISSIKNASLNLNLSNIYSYTLKSNKVKSLSISIDYKKDLTMTNNNFPNGLLSSKSAQSSNEKVLTNYQLEYESEKLNCHNSIENPSIFNSNLKANIYELNLYLPSKAKSSVGGGGVGMTLAGLLITATSIWCFNRADYYNNIKQDPNNPKSYDSTASGFTLAGCFGIIIGPVMTIVGIIKIVD